MGGTGDENMKRSRWIQKMVAAADTLEREVHVMPRRADVEPAPQARVA